MRKLKTTQYFEYRRTLPDRRKITDDLILKAIENPVKTETQDDGRIRLWGKTSEHYLRVVLLDDGETIHNAFYDRNFKE